VAQMAEHCDGEVMFFAQQGDSEVLTAHLQRGGRAVVVRDGSIVLVAGDDQSVLIKLAHVPVLENGNDAVQIDSVLAAVAAAWALRVMPGLIRAGLATFEVSREKIKDIA
jgi:cyanophycin synthetase